MIARASWNYSASMIRFTYVARLLGLLLCSTMLTACALSPQTVAIKPDVKVPSMPIGHNRAVSVETKDLRKDAVIGTLGGVYQSSYISTDGNMDRSLTQTAVSVLQSWDFAAVSSNLGSDDAARFTLEILEVHYEHPKTSVGGNVAVKCRIGVKVDMGKGSVYSGEYMSRRSEQVAVLGTVQGNKRIVNETINQALQQVFLDNKLQRFMAR